MSRISRKASQAPAAESTHLCSVLAKAGEVGDGGRRRIGLAREGGGGYAAHRGVMVGERHGAPVHG